MTTKNTEVANTQVLTPEELLSVVRDLASRAPVVAPAAVTSDIQRAKIARLNQDLVDASISAMSSTAEVQAALGRSDADVRDEDNESLSWAISIDAAKSLINDLAATNGRRRERVGLAALQTYLISKSLAKNAKHASTLAPHVATMKRILARTRGKKRPPQVPAPAPSPVPAPAPQQQVQ
jgi:hypothetical protein